MIASSFRPLLRHFALGICAAALASAAAAADNLLPNAEFRTGGDGAPLEWTLWSPRPELAPQGGVVTRDGARAISLRADRFESVGKWMAMVRAVEPGKFYRFEILHQAENVPAEGTNLQTILTWYSASDAKRELQRDYVLVTGTENGWQRSARTFQAPADAGSLRVELGFRWAPGGAVYWKGASLTQVAEPEARKVRVATTRIMPVIETATVAGNTKLMAEMFDRVGPDRPDVVLFSENLNTRFVRGRVTEKAQPIPGPLTEMLAQKAKQYRTYVITTLLEAADGLVHNTAVVIDREGKLVGKYRKVHLTMGESDSGLTPGNEYGVFDTDFGRIGILTCWDAWFPESARILRMKGAEIIFMPLAGDGQPEHWEHVWRARAIDNAVWFVTSATVTDSPSRILNPAGDVLADTRGSFGYAVADLNLSETWRVRYMSVGNGYGEPPSILIKERRPETYGPIMTSPATASGDRFLDIR